MNGNYLDVFHLSWISFFAEFCPFTLSPSQAEREHMRSVRHHRNALLETALSCREETQRRTRSLLNLSCDGVASRRKNSLPRWNSSTRVDRSLPQAPLRRIPNVPRSPLRIDAWRQRGARRRALESAWMYSDEASVDSSEGHARETSFLDSEAAVELSM